jgi:hypothetical protein
VKPNRHSGAPGTNARAEGLDLLRHARERIAAGLRDAKSKEHVAAAETGRRCGHGSDQEC